MTSFNRIDVYRKGRIDANDINEFLGTNNVDLSLEDVQKLITLFDVDKDGCLCKEEFIDLVLPNNNLELRR